MSWQRLQSRHMGRSNQKKQAPVVSKCYVCQEKKDVRPYGKDGQLICFPCMKASPERETEAENQFAALLARGDIVIDDNGVRRPTYDEAVRIEDVLNRSGGPDESA